MTDLLTYQLSDGVATIVMDDGKANVMSAEMISQLDAAFARARSDRAVVVLTGRGNIFSAGYDLAVFDQPQAVVAETMRAGGDLIQRILGHPHPTVAACNGHAIAQGAFTLLACDHRIGADGPFKTGLNEVAIGLTIPHYGIELARHQLASTWFDHATVTAKLYSPAEAERAGFFHELVAPGDVLARATEAARALGTLDPTAHEGTKQRSRRAVLSAMATLHSAEFAASSSATGERGQ